MNGRRDVFHSLAKWASYNRGLFLALILGGVLSGMLWSCAAKAPSLLDPKARVTAAEFEREVVTVKNTFDKRAADLRAAETGLNADIVAANQKIALAKEEFQRQEAIRAKVVEVLGGLGSVAASGGMTGPAAAGAAMQVLTLFAGAGLYYDNRRKDRVIRDAKTNGAPPEKPGSSASESVPT